MNGENEIHAYNEIMQCYLVSPHNEPIFLVPNKVFYNNFSQDDFIGNRIEKNLKDILLPDWFDFNSKDKPCFLIDSVALKTNGNTEFMSGRHRTAVLLRNLPEVPIAFVLPQNSRAIDIADGEQWALKLALKRIENNTVFNLPELPIEYP